MYQEEDFLPLSAIQHLLFCERQFALIHLEQIWDENVLTIEGRLQHKSLDQGGQESRGEARIVRGLYIQNRHLGLAGRADVIEFHREEKDEATSRIVSIEGWPGFWRPFPIEYKHGRPKPGVCDKAQLCAQAMCLEEMLNAEIDQGALFYRIPRRRDEVYFDEFLRQEVERAADRLRQLFAAKETPRAIKDDRCTHCSLNDLCSPYSTSGQRSVQLYIDKQIMGANADKL